LPQTRESTTRTFGAPDGLLASRDNATFSRISFARSGKISDPARLLVEPKKNSRQSALPEKKLPPCSELRSSDAYVKQPGAQLFYLATLPDRPRVISEISPTSARESAEVNDRARSLGQRS
jgi:hypothetical protein